MSALERGVPQSSVIGPLLYTILVNDITETVIDPNCLDAAHRNDTKLFGGMCADCGTINTYADDSTYTVSSRNRARNTGQTKDDIAKHP